MKNEMLSVRVPRELKKAALDLAWSRELSLKNLIIELLTVATKGETKIVCER